MVMGYAAGALSAQVLYGSIAGTLTDQTGAVVPKAVVSVKNTSTGLTRQGTTDEAGYYSIPNLAEGTYDLSVTATGFGPYTQTGVPVPINAVTRVDITLRVGAIAEQVSVEASSAVLQTTKSDVSSTITAQAIGKSAALELPQLPDPAQSGSRHHAGAVSERRHRHARTCVDDQRQRPGARREQHPPGWVG